jgi:hypothetical protein
MEPIKSKQYTWEDLTKRMRNPIQTVAFEVEFDEDDYAWEDTFLLPIAVPRAVWKLLTASAIGLSTTVQDVASEWLSDTAMDMIQNMKPLRDEAARGMDIDQLERDCMTLVLRLLSEDPNTFSPETHEVMERWKPKAWEIIKGGKSWESQHES